MRQRLRSPDNSSLPVSTVHHVLSTLTREGLLAKDERRRYGMGPRVGALAAAFLREQAVPFAWQRSLTMLADSTGETAYLAVWRGPEIRILAGVEGSRAVRVPDVQIGRYEHAHARATGKLLLALAEAGDRSYYLASHPPVALTARTLVDRAELEAEFERIRAAGYATEVEEFAEGVACLSVPIRDGANVLGAFTLAAPAARFHGERELLLGEALRAAAEAVHGAPEAGAELLGRSA